MTNPVSISAPLPDPAPAKPPVDVVVLRQEAAPTPPTANDTRLVIEEDKETRTFIYKTLDRRTGEVIQQFPRESLLRLSQEPGYTPGQVLKAST